jgi:hypothetical protein
VRCWTSPASASRGDAALAVGGDVGGALQAHDVEDVLAGGLGEVTQAALIVDRVGGEGEEGDVVLHRGGGAVDGDQALADLAVQGDRRGGVGERQGDAEDADDLLGATRLLEAGAQEIEGAGPDPGVGALHEDQPLEQRAALGVAGAVAEEGADLLERERRVVQLVEAGLGDASLQARGGLATLELDAPLPQRDQVAPPRLALEQALEAGLEALVARAEREQLLHVTDGAVGLAGEVAGDVRGLLEQVHAAGLADRCDEGLVVEGEEIGPALAQRVDRGELGEGPVGARLHGEDAEQDAGERGVVVTEPGLVEGGGAATEAFDGVGREVVGEGLAVRGGDFIDALEDLRELLGERPVVLLFGLAARSSEGGGEGLIVSRVGCHRKPRVSRTEASRPGQSRPGATRIVGASRPCGGEGEVRTIPGFCVSAGRGPVATECIGAGERALAGPRTTHIQRCLRARS